MPDDRKQKFPFSNNVQAVAQLIVGISASAGEPDACKAFFRNLPTNCGMAFVLLQHMLSDHDNMLTEMLQRETAIPVTAAGDGMALKANLVFVVPPNDRMTIKHGRLQLDTSAVPRKNGRPIDALFTSLAEDQGENAVGIVLSGNGSDGAAGVRQIKAHGGYTLARTEFDDHVLEGMPSSAVKTGLVDEVVEAWAMPEKLVNYKNNLHAAGAFKDDQGTRNDGGEHLGSICTLLQEHTGHDFSQYRDKTLTRRVQRRMQILQIESMERYTEHLRAEPRERGLLFHELLIGVTRFFRDRDAWLTLRQNIIPLLLEHKASTDSVRVWVPGCATGEEAYTVAILLQESLSLHDMQSRIQIFGTDINDNAVKIARAGRYKSLSCMAPEQARRWFVKEGDAYCPSETLRATCVFSSHDLAKDPPFSRLDLICCRNLLIYMKPELQDLVLRKFHYALNPDGRLFLGSSEGVSRNARLFSTIDKTHRLYQRRDAPTPAPVDFAPPGAPRAGMHCPDPHPMRRADDDRIGRSARRAMQKHSPAYVVIDRGHEILRFSGGETGRYLEPSAGTASLNLISLTKKTLRPAVHAAVQKAFNSGSTVLDEKLTLRVDGQLRAITLIVEPLETDEKLCLVAFQDTGPVETLTHANLRAQSDIAELQRELHTTRSQLHATISDLEASNEELASTNEEYQSINEELQSSNEELEISKEEMQSINEELHTINAELSSKNLQLNRANSDLRNLLESTEIATMFLDNGLAVKSFTPPMRQLFHLREGDHGRPVTDIATRLDYADLQSDVQAVLRNLSVVEREVRNRSEDTTYIMRIRPYRTVDNLIDGVVITFTDVTEHKRSEAHRARLAAIVDSTQDAIISKNLNGIIQTWNRSAEKLFGYSADEAIGQSILKLIPPERRHEESYILRQLRRGEAIGPYETVRQCKDGSLVHVSLSVSPFRNDAGEVIGGSKIVRDISERVESDRRRDLLLHEIDHRAKNMLANVQSIAMQTLGSSPTPKAFKKAFTSRLAALSLTHSLLTENNWRGVALAELVARELAPYQLNGKQQWFIEGEPVQLNAQATLALGLVMHELATNAAKYGALSTRAGRIEIRWQTRPDPGADRNKRLRLSWVECGGPAVETPTRRGFGSRLIENGPEHELDANVTLEFNPAGIRWTIDAMFDILTREAGDHETGHCAPVN